MPAVLATVPKYQNEPDNLVGSPNSYLVLKKVINND
jgi:hypothetical protein